MTFVLDFSAVLFCTFTDFYEITNVKLFNIPYRAVNPISSIFPITIMIIY
jgi:hypothetical protein